MAAATTALAQEKIWTDKSVYDKAECRYFERLAKGNPESSDASAPVVGSLANEVAKARQHIKKGLQCVNEISDTPNKSSIDVPSRFKQLEKENHDLRSLVQKLNDKLSDLSITVENLKQEVHSRHATSSASCPAKVVNESEKSAAKKDDDDDDDDIDLFGSDSDSEDEEAAKIRQERLSAYAAKKSKKPALIAKSSIILEVKPWDDETNMEEMEAEVRKITMDGLLWGAAKLVPLAYGIMKLQISCVIEDDKVSVEELTEKIEANEELVQSVDIAAFNKI